VQVADRLALLGRHEAGWQDPDPGGMGRAPAPWVRATASHAADALPMLLADQWFAAPGHGLRALLHDVDDDGVDELVLAGRRLLAVLRPRWGARVSTLVRVGSDAQLHLIVGNPADHWNFQEELGRFMDQPAGHPGALGVVGSEHVPFEVTRLEVVGHVLVAVLDEATEAPVRGNHADASPWPGGRAGLRLTVALGEDADALAACWTRHGTPGELSVLSAVCPDYRRALAEGRLGVHLETLGGRFGGARRSVAGPAGEQEPALVATDVRAWVGVPVAGGCRLEPPAFGDAGHAALVTVRAAGRHLDMVVGGGPAEERALDAHLALLRSVAHDGRSASTEPARQLVGSRGAS
jgi:hypothetical protein